MEWLNKIKNKLQFFSLGLMSGLIIGGGFFIFKLDDYFRELRAYKNAVQEQKNTEKEDQTKEVEKISNTKKIRPSLKKNYDPISNITTNDSLEIPDRDLTTQKNIEIDSALNTIVKDSIPNANINAENVIVRKDELVASKIIEIQNLNFTTNTSDGKKDSLLQKMSGIKDDVTKTSYKVEIWASPLNYKGYKMTKSKITLYGITNYETIKLYLFEDDIYLRTAINTYKLEYSSEFKPLEKTTDESVLAKLK